ncbi:MAG: lipoyl(octanoyl) transferase LipB [Bacteroidetes bacterium]|nr:lipoyl(octanoyl) transferase LipB [Bacteroidota bacterium]
MEYAEAWEYQRKVNREIREIKQYNAELPYCEQTVNYNYLLFCEHPHVYTLGKSGKSANLLVDENFLLSKGATFYKTDRGGDITYHGPGQIVGYPVFDLEFFGMGIKQYIHNLEEAIIRTLAGFSIKGERLPGATGVWLDVNNPARTRKICAIGVKVSRSVTMHGFAFNVNTNLDYYGYINPCGFTDKGVTSMKKETGFEMDMEPVKKNLLKNFAEVFGLVL